MDFGNLTSNQMDALREIGNIGAGNAATALSQMLGTKIDMTVPNVQIAPFKSIFSLIGSEEDTVACVNLNVSGDIDGTILLLFTEGSAFKLVDILMGKQIGTTTALEDLGESVLMEIGNILCASFLNAISSMTNLLIHPTVPALAFDMLNAVLSTAFIEAGQFSDYALVIDTLFFESGINFDGYFFLLPTEESLKTILKSVNMF